ncbi:transposase, partial [Mesoaciditoga lauensis]|uniref:transposase n=3 Tax=Mesoaciditoga lauensis TaxID=1495039 RepID=UPI001B8030B8
VRNYMSRWKIEVFFKSAKQRFNLGDCTLRNNKGQEHWMIIVSVAYLVFKVIMRLLAIRSEEGMKELIYLAISYMISMTNESKEAYLMLSSGLFSAFVEVGLIT